jgi:hypothetical protein
MRERPAATALALLVSLIALLAGAGPMLAQDRTTPSLPPAPQPTARLPLGAPGGSGNYVVSAAANEHGSFLWVVDSIQHAVTLCEKADGKEFTCTKHALP